MKQTLSPEITKPQYVVTTDITFAQVDSWYGHCRRDLKMDIIYPEDSTGKVYPCIVWICGGGWLRLDKSAHLAYLSRLAERGFAVASVEYRTSNEGVYPMQLQDVKAAIRYLRAHAERFRIDTDRVGVMGESAGGYLTCMAALDNDPANDVGDYLDQPSQVQAACPWYPPTNVSSFPYDDVVKAAVSPESQLLGYNVMTNKEDAVKQSPVSRVTPAAPPFLIIHGTKDRTVPFTQSEELYDVLEKAGCDVTLLALDGADELLKQSGVFRENQEVAERVMDSNDIERERGITILSKNTAVMYKGTKINIIDTPGHADFGGEVERVLKMVNGVILVVDAFEGAMPQTKFVLRKALELKLPVIVCINKIDRPEARANEVVDEVLELFLELDADDSQLDCPFVFASAKAGIASLDEDELGTDMTPLFETILDYIPAPEGDPEAGTQMLISTIDYNEYVGRIGIGKVENGTIKVNQDVVICNHHDPDKQKKVKVSKLYEFDGLNKVEVKEAGIGAIVAVSGITDIHIGDTLCSPENVVPIPFQKISEPTIAMQFIVNDSPLAGQEGKFVTSRHLRDRLFRELNTDVSLRVEETDSADAFKVSGRGELHLSVLIENMRREGYEFAVSKAEVLYKYDENGKKLEPMELAYIDVPDEFTGAVISKLQQRKGELRNMGSIAGGYTRLEFHIPSRGLIGYRGEFMTDTKGNGILNTIFDGYEPYKGDIAYRATGSLIAFETGESVAYGLFSAQERGTLFIGPGEKVYSGMVIGQCAKAEDIELNVCKKKHLTNTRSSSADDALTLVPPKILSLEQAIDFIDTDELLEVTPESLRIRKKILDPTLRKRAGFKKNS